MEHVRAEYSEQSASDPTSRAVVYLVDRDGRVLRTLSAEEASQLHTDLGVALGEYRRRHPPRMPANTGGYHLGRRYMIAR